MDAIDFDRSPFLVIWETTQACDLACLHCRAEARSCRDRDELSTDEARRLFRDVRRFGRVLLVLTGGDPAKRPDTVELIGYRARAYAESGDMLGAEPICAYQPPRWRASARARASLTLPTIPGRPV